MILFFKTPQQSVIATQADHTLNESEVQELSWLYRNNGRPLCWSTP